LSAILTEKEFSQHLNTNFLVNVEAAQPIELQLVELKPYTSKANEQSGLERFSLFFSGPAEFLLPQHTYTLAHEKMGKFDIFIVPISRTEHGCRYEAVFNYQIE
jgi:Domain of unknown function (DUF6916)